MIWHIFKKDWKLLWQLVVGVALVNVSYRVVLSSMGPLADGRFSPLTRTSYLLGTIGLLATGFLVATVALIDPIPGLRQDWLVRPIRRTDLLLSKIAFVALLVQGPIFVSEVAQGIAAGFPFDQCFGAPLSRSLWMFSALILPLFAFASLTRNLVETVGAGLGIFLVLLLSIAATQGLPVGTTGFTWVADSLQTICGLLGVAVVLGLQYYRRKTVPARMACGVAILSMLFAQLLPWQRAFAVEESLSPRPAASTPIQISLKSALGRFAKPEGFEPHRYVASAAVNDLLIYAPLGVTGIDKADALMADHIDARVTERDGKATALVNVWRNGPLAREFHQPIWVPESLYGRSKDQSVRIEIDYALTLLKPGPADAIPVNAREHLAHVGSCATRMNAENGGIDLGCITIGNPLYTTWFLRNIRTGDQTGENQGFPPDYSPWLTHLETDSMGRFRADFLIHELPGDVEGRDIQVMIRT
jgi:hypothetical protein